MKTKAILVLAVAVTVSAASPAGGEILYDVVDLGMSDRWINTSVSSINNAGQVVGSLNMVAVLFDSTGGGNHVYLGGLGGGFSHARSFNNYGQIVGWGITCGWIPSPCHVQHAALFDPTGEANNTDLGTLGGDHSYAYAINDEGQIVGRADTNQGEVDAMGSYSAYYHATIFDAAGDANNIDLGTLGGNISAAVANDDNGQIVGWAQTVAGEEHATLFGPVAGAGNIDLGTLGGAHSEALSVNDQGQIVGLSEIASGQTRATLFNGTCRADNMDLGTLEGYDCSRAQSINNRGEIVGYSYYYPAPPGFIVYGRATLFDPTGAGNNVDLNDLIDPNLGWTLMRPVSINDNGWIVGYGDAPDGYLHALLLKPTPRKVAIDNVKDAIHEKTEALSIINAALEKERAALEALNQLAATEALGDFNEPDLLMAKRQIQRAIFGERVAKRLLIRSRTRLEIALAVLRGQTPPAGTTDADVELERADVNADGVVDLRDFAIVTNRWLESYQVEQQ